MANNYTLQAHSNDVNDIVGYLQSKTPTEFAEDIHTLYNSLKEEDRVMLDSLKVANIAQDGPTKEIKGGQYGDTLMKYGKTATAEFQDALGNVKSLEYLGGAETDEFGNIMLTTKFSGNVIICGENNFVTQKDGKQHRVHEIIPQFLPNSILEITQEAEGDATVFSFDGNIITSTMKKAKEGTDTFDVQAAFCAENDAEAKEAFKRFGILSTLTNVIVIPWEYVKVTKGVGGTYTVDIVSDHHSA